MPRKPSRSDRRPAPSSVAPAGTLRILGGRLRGRPIRYLGDLRTRPMKQRVREAAFNLLGKRAAGMHVIDLFAGTGALSWEALSRGASTATLIERHFPTARQLRETARELGLAEQVEIVASDTFFWARSAIASPAAHSLKCPPGRAWLVFCSPPYDLYVTQLSSMLELVRGLVDLAPEQSLMVVESDQRFDAAQLTAKYEWDVRPYPPAVLAVGQQGIE